MGRKTKNTVEYFPHFAEHGKTLFILKSRFGNNGYAFWFQLLEILCREEGHFYDCREEHAWQYLLAVTGVDEITGAEMLSLLSKLGNIDAEIWGNKVIWCKNLVSNLEDVYKKRARVAPSRETVLNIIRDTATEIPITATEIPITATEMPQSKVNYIKVHKESKERKNVFLLQAFEIFWEAYPKKRNRGQAEKAFKKAVLDEQLLAVILTAIEQAKKSAQWLKADGEFIPYPATWINAEGWKDEFIQEGGRENPNSTDRQTEPQWKVR